jgi:hypothetical protein
MSFHVLKTHFCLPRNAGFSKTPLNKKSALETKALYPEPNKPVNYLPF